MTKKGSNLLLLVADRSAIPFQSTKTLIGIGGRRQIRRHQRNQHYQADFIREELEAFSMLPN
jgi:hypothetical protein